MGREGQLNENAVDGRVRVDLDDFLEDLRLGDSLGEIDKFAVDVCLEMLSQLFASVVGRQRSSWFGRTSSAAFSFMRTYVPSPG